MLPVLVSEAAVALRTVSPTVISRLATKLNVPSTVAAISAAMKNNPVTTALVGLELFGAASDFVNRLISSNPEVASVVSGKAADFDKFSTIERPTDIIKYDDELKAIDDVAAFLGGRDNLDKLRAVLAMDIKVWELRDRIGQMGFRR